MVREVSPHWGNEYRAVVQVGRLGTVTRYRAYAVYVQFDDPEMGLGLDPLPVVGAYLAKAPEGA